MSTSAPTWSTADRDDLPRLVIEDGATGRVTDVPVWTALTRRQRRIGLLGTDSIDGALWITRCGSVHCVGMRHTIDVVYLTGSGKVIDTRTMRPGTIGRPRLRGRAVLELPGGRAAELGIRAGVRLST